MLGWGVLGCGDITEKRGAPAILALQEAGTAHVVAFHSRTAARARAFAGRFGAPRWTADRAELLADPEVHAVYVATEHHRHYDDVLAAAAAGKHVLCEKPLANSVAECREMIAECRARGVALQVAYYRRYYPKMIRMKELLDAGAIGEPVTAQIHLASRLPEGGTVRPDGWDPYAWRLDPARSGGGQLVDTGSHRLDLLCWLLGEPERVAALAECREFTGTGAPDMETLLIRMACGTHVVSRHGYRTRSGDELEISGTEGTLSATPVDGPALRLTTAAGEQRWELPKHENVHYPLFEDFTRRVAAGLPPRYTGEDGLQASRIIEAAYASARSGQVVAP